MGFLLGFVGTLRTQTMMGELLEFEAFVSIVTSNVKNTKVFVNPLVFDGVFACSRD